MKWKRHSLVILSSLAALFLGGVAMWAQLWLASQTRVEIGKSLSTVLGTTEQAIRSWAREHRLEAWYWASTPEVLHLTRQLLATPTDRESLLGAPAQQGMQEALLPISQTLGYMGFFIINAEGISLSSSRQQNIGTPNILTRHGTYLERAWDGESFMSSVLPSDVPLPDASGKMVEGAPTMFFGAPVKDSSGRVIAVFTFRVDPYTDFTRLLQRGRIGNTGETYALDSDGRLISESRFEDAFQKIGILEPEQESILNIHIRDPGVNLMKGERPALRPTQRPLTRMAAEALSGKRGMDLNGYRDYRGVPVVGAWSWCDDLGFALATEIDVAEAFRVLKAGQILILLLTLLSIGFLIGLSFVFTRSRRCIEKSETLVREANRELEAFVYTVSHDLRTPLTSIIGFSQYLKDDYDSCSKEVAIDSLGEIEGQGLRMLALLEDLLALARVGHIGRPDAPVDVERVVAQSIEDAKILASGRVVQSSSLPGAYIPEPLLAQLFDNLIGNALRHAGEEAGPVEVGGERRGDKVLYYVCDHGNGVPVQEKERIFEVFYRGSTGKNTPGTGVGLATVQKIARLYGGRAWVEDTPGGGSTFWVEMESPVSMASR